MLARRNEVKSKKKFMSELRFKLSNQAVATSPSSEMR